MEHYFEALYFGLLKGFIEVERLWVVIEPQVEDLKRLHWLPTIDNFRAEKFLIEALGLFLNSFVCLFRIIFRLLNLLILGGGSLFLLRLAYEELEELEG